MTNFWQTLQTPFTVLAPMDDVTDNAFRQVINEVARPDVFFTEFTSAAGLNSAGTNIVGRKLRYEKDQRPIVAQIWGNDPVSIEKAAKIISQFGFDGIDINMGCPIHNVVRKHAGAGLIGNYKLAHDIIAGAKNGAPTIPLSVKTRLGIDTNIAHEWCTFLLEQDIQALTIHARTAAQMSTGSADWGEIEKIVELRNQLALNTVIIGNGDIKSYDQVVTMSTTHKVDGIMIGRGIFSNPWIFSKQTKEHSREEYLNLLEKHFNYFVKEYPDPKLLRRRYSSLKKFFKMYITGFNGANLLRQQLMETNSLEEAKKMLKMKS